MSHADTLELDEGFMTIKKYQDLKVYGRGFDLAVELHEATKVFSSDGEDVRRQMRRSSKSICALVAEGYGRRESQAEFRRYLRMAHGSLQETRVWIEFGQALGFWSRDTAAELWRRYDELGKMLYGLSKTWRSFPEPSSSPRPHLSSDP